MLIALSGPSGIGKGYIKRLVFAEYPDARELVWITTRQLRPDEAPGGNRRSMSREEFDNLVATGDCVLAQDLYGNGYGLIRDEFLACDGVWLTEFHPENLAKARALRDDIIAIGLVTDDHEMLAERLSLRGGTANDRSARLREAASEMDRIRGNPDYQLIARVTRETEEVIGREVAAFILNQIRRTA